MISVSVLFAFLSIAFPKEGASLPAISRCYVSGAVSPGVTNILVQGCPTPVHTMGGWVTMVELQPGENIVSVEANGETTTRVFRVAAPRIASSAVVPTKKYEKLPYAGDEPRAHPRGRVPTEVTIALDAGHGGEDSGALSPHGIGEKDANLKMMRAVRRELEKMGFRVVVTREEDVSCPLYDRPKLAHAAGADAFVSIHHNAPPLDKDPRTIRYHAVYAWNEIGESLAKSINAEMALSLGEELKNNGVMHANFAVTRNPEIPSCLIEVDFITTPEGELDCWNVARRQKIAVSIAQGITKWCEF